MEDEERERRSALVHLVRRQLPTKVRHASFESFDASPDAAALRLAQQWVDVVQRWYEGPQDGDSAPSVFLTSERQGESVAAGNGKSHLLAAALLELAERGIGRIYTFERGADVWSSLMWITSADLIANIRSTYNNRNSEMTAEQVVSRYAWADVLVLDDVGTEPSGEDATSHLFRLLERRAGKPTAYSSNYGRKDLSSRSPEWAKLASRMGANLKGAVLRGPDRREPERGTDAWGEWK